jgi:hypothetical protein
MLKNGFCNARFASVGWGPFSRRKVCTYVSMRSVFSVEGPSLGLVERPDASDANQDP